MDKFNQDEEFVIDDDEEIFGLDDDIGIELEEDEDDEDDELVDFGDDPEEETEEAPVQEQAQSNELFNDNNYMDNIEFDNSAELIPDSNNTFALDNEEFNFDESDFTSEKDDFTNVSDSLNENMSIYDEENAYNYIVDTPNANMSSNIEFDELPEDDIDELNVDLTTATIDDTNASDYDGSVVDSSDLYDEDEDTQTTNEVDFITDSGGIVVQDKNDNNENGFKITYVNIDNIAITPRIRKMHSVEGLVQSIQSTGLLMPLMVAPLATEGMYVLLDGYRRLQACARAGKTKIPCVINTKVSTPEIPILESMYNHSQKYSIKEQIDYIDYLEKEKGIMNPAMIEYLLQMNSGDYTKLKDILNDNDDDIVTKLIDGVYDIATAFKKLEQRRKKESLEEKENKKAARVYDDAEESGVNQIEGAGEEADGAALTDEQLASLSINLENFDNDLEDTSLGEMIEEDKKIEGFEPHSQEVGKREYVDPIIKKSVMTRDNSTCRCCLRGGEQYVDILDFHHITPVFMGGADTVDNGVMLCVACHRLVHLYSTGDLHIDRALLEGDYDSLTEDQKSRFPNEEIFEDEKMRFKRILKFGGVIRKGIRDMGMNREQYKKEHPNTGIGRRKPGVNAEQEIL